MQLIDAAGVWLLLHIVLVQSGQFNFGAKMPDGANDHPVLLKVSIVHIVACVQHYLIGNTPPDGKWAN